MAQHMRSHLHPRSSVWLLARTVRHTARPPPVCCLSLLRAGTRQQPQLVCAEALGVSLGFIFYALRKKSLTILSPGIPS